MYYSIKIKSWEDIKSISTLKKFIYRGQKQSNWLLKPTLERAADRHLMPYDQLLTHEYLVYRKFRSISNQYLKHIPNNNNYLEWMTILQHYGAPTRLLDFTTSIYIAAFFAFEFAIDDCTIWGLNYYTLNKLLIEKMFADKKRENKNLMLHDYSIEIANKIFSFDSPSIFKETKQNILNDNKIIFAVTPDLKNERLAIQKGIFLMPSELDQPFESILIQQLNLGIDNLSDSNANGITIDDFIKDKIKDEEDCLVKLIVPRKVCIDGLYDLDNMNINAATLSPGLDGQARSLNLILRNMEKTKLQLRELLGH